MAQTFNLSSINRYRREDLLIIWVLIALFFSLPLLLCISLLGFILLYAWFPAPWRAQHRVIIITGLLVGGILAFLSLPSLFSGESLLALAALIATLKRAELKSERDQMVLIVAVFIVNTLNLIYWNSLPALLHLLVLIGLMLWLVQQTPQQANKAFLRGFNFPPALNIVAWSLPLALVLFLFVPRIPGPLWDVGLAFGLPISIYQDLTPFPEPNTRQQKNLNNPLANLQAQQQIVLVAEFESAVPSKSTLYWRGPVIYGYEQGDDEEKWLTDTENTSRGQRLRTAYRDIPAYRKMIQHTRPAVNYDVKVAPNADNWLYAPDLPSSNAQESFISKDGQLLSIRPIHQEFTYSTSSYLDGILLPQKTPIARLSPSPSAEAENIKLTAAQWQQTLLTDTDNNRKIVTTEAITTEQNIQDQLLTFLSQPPEWFNAKPPYTSDKVQRWTGITMLTLQQAGLPARMVSGFRGGDLIALTNVIVVRQKHQHYWLELWQPDRGWVRIDIRDILSHSTTARDINQTKTRSAQGEQSSSSKETSPSINADQQKNSWLQRLEKWLNQYTPSALIDDEGSSTTTDKSTLIKPRVWAVALLSIWLGMIIFSRIYQQRAPAMELAWKQFQKTMAAQGFLLEQWQCPSVLAHQLQQRQPDWSEAALKLINTYLNYHYGTPVDTPPRVFNAQVKRLSLALKNTSPKNITAVNSSSEIKP